MTSSYKRKSELVEEDNSKFNTLEKNFDSSINLEFEAEIVGRKEKKKESLEEKKIRNKKKKVTFDQMGIVVVAVESWKEFNLVEEKTVTDCECTCTIM